MHHSQSSQSVTLTEAGRKYLQLHHFTAQPQLNTNINPNTTNNTNTNINTNTNANNNEQTKPTNHSLLPLLSSSSSFSSSSAQHHRIQLHRLPFRLDKLYRNTVLTSAKQQLQSNINRLQDQILKDLGYNNSFTIKKANQLVDKLCRHSNKINTNINNNNNSNSNRMNVNQHDQNYVTMEISKSRNYLGRINHLYYQGQGEYQRMKRSIQKLTNKQNDQ